MLHTLSSQLGIADPSDCVIDYRTTRQRWQHTSEIRTRYGYREFTGTGVQFRLGRWLCALCWTGTDRPSALFDYANGWLVGHRCCYPASPCWSALSPRYAHAWSRVCGDYWCTA
nr:DUF4158 domain-containing protein [Burkholderia glumae]